MGTKSTDNSLNVPINVPEPIYYRRRNKQTEIKIATTLQQMMLTRHPPTLLHIAQTIVRCRKPIVLWDPVTHRPHVEACWLMSAFLSGRMHASDFCDEFVQACSSVSGRTVDFHKMNKCKVH